MAWGDKGTLFVGSFGLGNDYAIKETGGKREVKTVLCGTADKVDPNQRGEWMRVSELPDSMVRNLDVALLKRYYSPLYGFGRVNSEAGVREAFRLAGVDV